MKYYTIGKNIRHYRLKKKMSQEELAEKTDLSQNYIGMIERGEKNPSLETFISILNVLGVSADMVLCEVVTAAYDVKASVYSEKINKLSEEDRNRIYAVTDTLIKYSKQIKP